MIALRLMGGIGNQMFIIATGETWRNNGYDVVYTNMDENLDYIAKNYTPKRNSERYKRLFENFDWDKNKAPRGISLKPAKVKFTYTEIVPQDGTEYIGYFQSPKYFPDHDFIRWLFQLSEEEGCCMAYPICEYSCSIHVRRQDYLKVQDYHTVLDIRYYADALLGLSATHRIDKYYIFSDDIAWCKDHFSGDEFVFMNCNECSALYLMGRCKHNVIANSSLSWFGAFLGDPADRTVIYPSNWFGPKGEDSRDMFPWQWRKV